MEKERQVYVEKYKKGSMWIKEGCLPVLKHTDSEQAVDAQILAAGIVERDGRRLEFHDIRVYMEA